MIHPLVHLIILNACHAAAIEYHRQLDEAEQARATLRRQQDDMHRQREVLELERIWRMS